MGLFDKIFKKPPKMGNPQGYFETLTAYSPMFTTWGGAIYESELVRSAIHARAIHISKLKVEINGTAKPKLQAKLRVAPNEWQTWSQFLYRLSTILDVNNTAFIVPVMDDYGEASGVFPVLPTQCAIVQYNNEPWLRYQFTTGQFASIELRYCGIMTKFQYSDDFFGDSNRALNPTMELIDIQNQGITEGVKSAATFRFMARMGNFAKSEDLTKERDRFTRENLKGSGGLLLFPNTYDNIQQIKSSPYVVDAEQMKLIYTNVNNYFGVNEDVLQNKAYGDKWSAFYEGAIEPFAIQFSEVMTKMLFTLREKAQGSEVIATSNRIQYMSNSDKLQISSAMLDRGIFNRDEIREMWNLAPLPNGEGKVYIMRGEYQDKSDELGESKNDGQTENEA